jgi:hypothetical protein
VLCQLSYAHHPPDILTRSSDPAELTRLLVARQKGFEPLTHGLEGRCSVHLSYWRESGRADLNGRPPAPKAGALPGCATPRTISNNIRRFASQPRIRHGGDLIVRSHAKRTIARSTTSNDSRFIATDKSPGRTDLRIEIAVTAHRHRQRMRFSRVANLRRSKFRHLPSLERALRQKSNPRPRPLAESGEQLGRRGTHACVLRITAEINRLDCVFDVLRVIVSHFRN